MNLSTACLSISTPECWTRAPCRPCGIDACRRFSSITDPSFLQRGGASCSSTIRMPNYVSRSLFKAWFPALHCAAYWPRRPRTAWQLIGVFSKHILLSTVLEGQLAPPQLGLVITRLVLCWLPEVPHCEALHCDQVDQELTRQFTDEQLRRLQDWLSVIKFKVNKRRIKALVGVLGSITDPA